MTMTILLILERKIIPNFYQLFRQGFRIKARVGCNIRELLCQQLGVPEDYLENRIQTIFLNGKSVDDVNTAILREGSILALSAAMPGLAGATLRKGGRFAPLRSRISHHTDQKSISKKEGMVILKLFNLLVSEIGPIFLQQGIWLQGSKFKDLLDRQPEDFFSGILSAEVNDEKVDLDQFEKTNWEGKDIFLQVKTE